ncbi:hypothetical protein OO015_03680 [Thermomicrobium sp. 4228-Ro]|uniref:hypothetical protein n=1 Tax=Thermomicrobium sp. 4228-Ro TaxID=2993937 RepID=UPI0022498271|nr:hypothetical protein [Thermomicrobium sp. 4228-Ro]MCX2726592.1 hypothetical protein [Thermomicrobium sp. 4228-Ro]
MPVRRIVGVLALVSTLAFGWLPASSAQAETNTFADAAFAARWERVDRPVAAGVVQRSWIWGPTPLTGGLTERYQESPDRTRLVQYFDKGRMELTHPEGDPSAEWFVTGGLLTRELVSGRIQIGDQLFLDAGRGASVPVAGDPDNPFPTYADLAWVVDRSQPDRTGQAATAVLSPEGWSERPDATEDPDVEFVRYITYTGPVGEPVGYNIPRAFWTFMTQPGLIWQGDHVVEADPVFDWLFVLGYPIADPFWVQVRVRGQPTWVLVQPFERRILTYTPSNPPGWRVEMGNIGQHYLRWRYAQTPPLSVDGDSAVYGLAPGTRSVYSSSSRLDETWQVSGPSTSFIAGSQLIVREELRGSSRWYTYWAVTEQGLALAGWERFTRAGTFIETVVFWPALAILAPDRLHEGQSWESTATYLSTRVGAHTITLRVSVDEQALVGTPYGVVPAWRLTFETSDPPTLVLSYLDSTLWFSPNLGIVQWTTDRYAAQLREFTLPS